MAEYLGAGLMNLAAALEIPPKIHQPVSDNRTGIPKAPGVVSALSDLGTDGVPGSGQAGPSIAVAEPSQGHRNGQRLNRHEMLAKDGDYWNAHLFPGPVDTRGFPTSDEEKLYKLEQGSGTRFVVRAQYNIPKATLIMEDFSMITLFLRGTDPAARESGDLYKRLAKEVNTLYRIAPAVAKWIRDVYGENRDRWPLYAWDRYSLCGPKVGGKFTGHWRSLFTSINWISHCCLPNSRLDQVRNSNKIDTILASVCATEDILKGEEVTLFFDSEDDPARRQAVLGWFSGDLRNWFRPTCGCRSCSRGFHGRESWQARKK
ncbi:hypothetical protein MBM_02244 [Drepanopeziza brunnea f. sp. 'multigermtubi' MB_m1]|uniref:SET domain-containing protein n=1 Tax=Marssonina brunnea f. sp. multigermtubi (strain MB_m1) TaxID=1072389 RepID=K1X1X3_MARBU|nr:uncharacterized protein MBM_02244 [Drepanopeziza brunnea f. sp. 'multigermtubi' MB_m1]EKD19007.1 hypothetical protein MBM_02244 [Drepanopeziza brunnea f. sp. 'multigermtubi' MB_m1]